MDGTGAAKISAGLLIINADDWGRNVQTTDRILDCFTSGPVSSASAMVFMEDSERAAFLAQEHRIDTGLHLNFTTFFSGECSAKAKDHQDKLARYLTKNRIAKFVYHPGLSNSFDYVLRTQVDEYERLYGAKPHRLDGHHHMHLCANVLCGNLLPAGSMVRRNFSFELGEKGIFNRTYRKLLDRYLESRFQTTDYFFSLETIKSRGRLDYVFQLAREHFVELETHPVNRDEYETLLSGTFSGPLPQFTVASRYTTSRKQDN